MAFILTFLGKGGTGKTTLAIAAAKEFASQGQRVLLAGQSSGPGLGLLLETPLEADPKTIAPNLQVVQLQTSVLLERNWETLKEHEAQYLRSPFLKSVYGQELGVLPGMDSALALNAIREYDAKGNYDVIVYDGLGDQTTLRMMGMPEILSWYLRRFREVFDNSGIGSILAPFVQPFLSSVLQVGVSGDSIAQPTNQAQNILEKGRQAIADPNRIAAYLLTTPDPLAIAQAKYLWGAAQQVGLTVGGVLLNYLDVSVTEISEMLILPEFSPLPVRSIPYRMVDNWEPLQAALPNFREAIQVPRPITIDVAAQTVSLFLPGFDKKQVKLIQSGPEITIEAGDQRRNLYLPPELSGRSATGAKFHDDYLTISL
ncbi:ABC transporter ATPase [Neosynechococcus sphagnicola sy1]|uniref:ABC transporter ATPase n=1 Tax=Neosynechococcus sphagnicola sy1 TaxID=1497020 RepID=A0A098TLY8_9CYAN|nr:ArsA family ATPase [Neosynechococcus sphagnicola]KGF72882.1 ABC transporter ATPase [Neosynechococcus sphagnicola sy1]